ncbi:cobaltochelatase subunit CobN [Paraburkholderia rhizosphaerae]|uniref:Cobaltochelatase subunit CobN n=1 Tax=Paraburkholderia rhizosphaerae TaxID=480658 RepID=A0A4R8LVL6_9BURK|nr:cobaltochelatase subunit CobN [Paraburkholderia rhizosphaerae]TDY50827.1 cobaltochelatase CobN subunit [Paraburkholderia rhizosphaerae]
MHLLRTTPGGFVDDTKGVIRIDQRPAEIVVLSSADTTLSLLASVVPRLPAGFPSVRLANVTYLRQPASVDFYVEDVLQHARVVVVDHLGGEAYWPYGIEQVVALAERKQQTLAMFSGDLQEDPNLTARSTADAQLCHQLWRYLREGGPQNAEAFLRCIAHRALGFGQEPALPVPLPAAALYHPRHDTPTVADWQARWRTDAPVVAILFYKAHLQAANTAVFDALIDALEARQINPLPIAITSLKDALSRDVVETLCEQHHASLVLNTTAFAASAIDDPAPLALAGDAPVLQVILSGGNRADWLQDNHGLNSRDIAMHVALPEVDGRIITRAISFKGLAYRCPHTEVDVVRYQPDPERVAFVAELSERWCRLRSVVNADKKIALILANYPASEGRIGNGVGLDTPASVVGILNRLRDEGYCVADNLPADGDALLRELTQGVTNDPAVRDLRPALQSFALADYEQRFARLPASLREALNLRWGPPAQDPTVRRGRFMIAGWRCGHVFVGIQPSRSREQNDYASYHDAELVPPHAYLAFYFWLRDQFGIDALVHVGKHGNLEWLPGKSVALSDACWPDAILGPMPHLYPFIVNDPGEGSQAKRRAQAVIVDHLMPPLTRAESYGPLQDLERQVDEYYEALMVDPRRAKLLRRTILSTIIEHRLHDELSIAKPAGQDAEDALLTRVDAWLCELKEAQIRDGLHTFGQSPRGVQRRDTLLALGRYPVGDGQRANAGLIDALARDLRIDHQFDPLSADWSTPWQGARPALLQQVSDAPWRHNGDARERLELLAGVLIAGLCDVHATTATTLPHAAELPQTALVLQRLHDDVLPRLDACGEQEMRQLQRGLEGRFVPPGPSGSPSRGRPDVLPTGRNFYSVDTRAIPTQAAWALGVKSAQQLLERHLQEHGDYPRAIGLSVWGTATMRTGGDDIAQALALIGVRPKWAPGSHRVTDFEIMPIAAFDRPRIDVTLRVSGFFRDAFPNVMHLFDAAVQAVAELDDEPGHLNPIRARVLRERDAWIARGLDAQEARKRAGWRVFSARPGAYGAGLQEMIDARQWQTDADLANAYLAHGGYAYTQKQDGEDARHAFGTRLATLDVVLQNQDNREHDVLDSNDYYQFQGGMAAAVRHFSGSQPQLYHADHSNPNAPRVRTLNEEIARVIRSRVVNPKWLDGVKRHGYKGAAEIAATVDYLYGYDATARVIADHQYALVADAYLNDADTRAFLQAHNPHALHGICERLLEAMQRGLWLEPGAYREQIEQHLLASEQQIEGTRT